MRTALLLFRIVLSMSENEECIPFHQVQPSASGKTRVALDHTYPPDNCKRPNSANSNDNQIARTVRRSSNISALDFSPPYRAWRDRKTIVGIRYYGRYGVYDGPPLTKPIDFLDACKVPIFVVLSTLLTGLAGGSLSMVCIGTFGLSLFSLAYLLTLAINRRI